MLGLRTFVRVQRRFLLHAVLCIGLTSLAAFFFVRSILTPDTGLVGWYPEAVMSEGALTFAPTAPYSAAAASGVMPREDRILSVNGRGVSNSWELYRAASSVRRFDPFPVVVQGQGGEVRTIEVKPLFTPTRIDWFFGLVFCMALAVLSFSLSWRLSREPGILPLVLSALLFLLFTCMKPFAYEGLASNILFNLGNVSSWLLVIFAMFFPWSRGRRSLRRVAVAAIAVFFAAFCALRVGLYLRWSTSGEETWLALYKAVGQVGNVSDALAYALLAWLLASGYRNARAPADRKLLQWMLAGILIAIPPYFFLDQLPLVLGGTATQVGLGSFAELFLTILPVFLIIGLARDRAFDMRSFLNRYVAYGALSLIMVAFFLTLYLPLRGWFASAYQLAPPLPELLAAATLVLALALLRPLLMRALARRAPPAPVRSVDGPPRDGRAGAMLEEQRTFLRGVARVLREPVRRLSEAASRAGPGAQEAATRAAEMLHAFESHASGASWLGGIAPVQAIARAAAEQARSRIPGARVEVHVGGDTRGPGLSRELSQALAYALENAIEAQDGAAEIRATMEGTRVVFEIADHGAGVDPAVRSRLCSPFVSTKPGHPGLGLYFARLITEKNRGVLEIAPNAPRGTVVRFNFDAAVTDATVSPPYPVDFDAKEPL
jgi:signal transduction histidine kinase